MRPGSSFAAAIAAIERLVARGLAPQLVFVPTRLNLHEIVAAFDLAAALGCSAFVTGPLMRLGRAAADWDRIACTRRRVAARGRRAARARGARARRRLALSIYPWDIVTEIETRLDSPQAMLLVVPNGKVKLLNALPFAPADLRRDSLRGGLACLPRRVAHAARCATSSQRCRSDPALLRHANETWPMQARRLTTRRRSRGSATPLVPGGLRRRRAWRPASTCRAAAAGSRAAARRRRPSAAA